MRLVKILDKYEYPNEINMDPFMDKSGDTVKFNVEDGII